MASNHSPDDLSRLICGTRLTTSFVPLVAPGSLCNRAPFWPIALVEGGDLGHTFSAFWFVFGSFDVGQPDRSS